ncbi:MAG: LTA synthase family protein [Bacilli bacterium]
MKEKVKKTYKTIRKSIVEYIITNRLFISYVILAIIGTMFLRYFTLGTFFYFKSFITDLAVILIIGGLGYFVKPKNQFKYYFIWLIIFTIINVVNSIYYKFYVNFTSVGYLSTLSQAETVTGSIFEKVSFYDVMYILVPVIFYVIHKKLLASSYYYFVDKIEKGKKMVVTTLLVGILCLGYSFGTATGTDYSRLAKQWNRVYVVERFGILLYQINDVVQVLRSQLSSLFGEEEALEAFNAYFDQKEEHIDNEYTGILEGKNIILVHLEGMQTFLMDLEFNGQEVTPNLNKLASEGMFFSNFYPQVSTGTSSDTEFTILTGLMPAASGAVFTSYYDRNYFTIPKYLNNLGYYTFSMHGNSDTMWGRNLAHPSLGYEGMYFESSFTYKDEDVINLGINDQLFFKQAIPIMENIENTYENYMGYVITLSNHSPFSDAATHSILDLTSHYTMVDPNTLEVVEMSVDYLSDTSVGEYIKSANYADIALGDFINYINESDAFDNTVFVFFGDHDAKLNRSDINYLYNLNPVTGKTYSENDEEYVEYDYYDHELNKKTPLIIWTKDKSLKNVFKGEITYYTGMYNVAPTILNMYGLYNKYTVGDDIFNSKDDNIIVFPNGNILTEKVYYNNSTGEYKVLEDGASLDEDYISDISLIGESRLEISNYIIVYNLLNQVTMTGE